MVQSGLTCSFAAQSRAALADLQTNKQKAEAAKEAKAVSEGQKPAKPKKGMSKAEREAEKHRKKIAERPSRKGKNALMEVCPHLRAADGDFWECSMAADSDPICVYQSITWDEQL